MPAFYQNPMTAIPPNATVPMQTPTMQQQPQQTTPNTNMIWVQGIEGAKAFSQVPGTRVVLMDSEDQCFYIKEVDSSGIPKPLRAFDFTERKIVEPQFNNASNFVTADQLNDILDEKLSALVNTLQQRPSYQKKGGNNGKPVV